MKKETSKVATPKTEKPYSKKVIAIYNRKGGSGKTTCSINLAGWLKKKYKAKILLIDADSQANLSKLIYLRNEKEYSGNEINLSTSMALENVLKGDVDFSKAIYPVFLKPQKAFSHKFDIVPVSEDIDNLSIVDPRTLDIAIKKLRRKYDYIIIDCPPAKGDVTANVLCASDYVIVPVNCAEDVDVSGIDLVKSFTEDLRGNGLCDAKILGYILNKFDKRDEMQVYNADVIRESDVIPDLGVVIPYHKWVAQANFYGVPICWSHPTSEAAKEFEKLADIVDSLEKRNEV